jgi:hypothetical protein
MFEEDFAMIQEVGIVEEWILQGEARGEVRGARETLLRLGHKRFGAPGADVVEALEAISSAETLQQMAVRLLDVESWEELLASA